MGKYVAPGTHLLIDFWTTRNLQNQSEIRKTLRTAAKACGARVLKILLHSFGTGAGITGVAILAESHISIHTWPEIHYVAIDIFMCGSCDPHRALPLLRKYFQPKKFRITTHFRGKPPTPHHRTNLRPKTNRS